MKKYFPHISAFMLTVVIVFTISGFVLPQTAHAGIWDTIACATAPIDCGLRNFTTFIMGMVLQFVALLTGLAGIILNGAVYLTVVKVADNYSSIPAISVAWGLVRDVANMSFIFVLLYAAIRTILGIDDGAKKLIVNIVVVAILINFSLFFTKVVIDASNVLSIMFYDAIAPNALNSAGTLDLTQRGLSNAFMKHLSLQSLYKVADTGKITIGGIMIIGVMGSIMLLIAAFVFFAVAIMFIIRYVVLILVLILSPLAFIAMVLPALKPQANKWRDALIGQAFFAPIYFMLTWVTLSILGGVMSSFNTAVGVTTATTTVGALGGISTNANGEIEPNQDTFSMFINFSVIIVFLIASLIIAKEWANKAGPGVAGMTKWAMGAAGGASLGMAGRFGRNTLGRAGAGIGDSESLKERASKGGMGGMAARLTLATGRRTGAGSFDLRGTPIGGQLDAGKAQKGGFIDYRKKKAEEETKFANSLGASDKAKAKAKTEYERTRQEFGGNSPQATAARNKLDLLEGVKKDEVARREKAELMYDPILKKEKEVEKELKDKEAEIASTTLPELKTQREKEKEDIKKALEIARKDAEEKLKEIKRKYRDEQGNIQPIKDMGDTRKEKFARVVETSPLAKLGGYNYAAAAQIRKGKSAKDKIADAVKDLQKEETPSEEGDGTAPPTPPPTPPTPPTP